MYKDLRLYDWEGNFLCNVSQWKSLDWQIMYNSVGTFEGHFSPESKVVDAVLGHPRLIAVQGGYQAIVTGYLAAQDDFAVYGRDPGWLLTRRVVRDYTECTKTVEDHARALVQAAYADTPCVTLGDPAGYTEQVAYLVSKPAQLGKCVEEILALDGAGYRMVYDLIEKKWVFSVTRGVVRPKLLSCAYNAYDMQVSYDFLDEYNAGWYEQAAPEPAEGEEKGEPVWTHIDGTQTGIYLFDAVLSGKERAEAEVDLAKKAVKKTYSAMVRNLVYGEDYQLGDTLRFQFQAGAYRETVEKKVTGVNLSYGEAESQQPILEG